MFRSVILFVTVIFSLSLTALDTTEFSDPKMQKRYQELTEELRCLVCQNETIAGSNAPLAKDLRKKVSEQLRAGKTDDEVREYLIERFGQFVSYRPSRDGAGSVLWIAPIFFMGLALFAFFLVLRKNEVIEE